MFLVCSVLHHSHNGASLALPPDTSLCKNSDLGLSYLNPSADLLSWSVHTKHLNNFITILGPQYLFFFKFEFCFTFFLSDEINL